MYLNSGPWLCGICKYLHLMHQQYHHHHHDCAWVPDLASRETPLITTSSCGEKKRTGGSVFSTQIPNSPHQCQAHSQPWLLRTSTVFWVWIQLWSPQIQNHRSPPRRHPCTHCDSLTSETHSWNLEERNYFQLRRHQCKPIKIWTIKEIWHCQRKGIISY